MHSISRLLIRLCAYLLVGAGLISAEFAEFLVYDPDVAMVVSGVLSVVVVEVTGIAVKRSPWYRRYRKRKREEDENASPFEP